MTQDINLEKVDFYALSVDVFNATDSESQIDLINMLLEKLTKDELKEFIDSSFFGDIQLTNYISE
jgi:hypothetical protein